VSAAPNQPKTSALAVPCLVALLAGLLGACASAVGGVSCGEEVISNPPVYGSSLAGGTLLDAAHSCIRPTRILDAPGSLPGHWLAADEKSELVVEAYDPERNEVLSGYEADHAEDFRMTLVDRGQSWFQWHISASYSVFQLFAADVDGDGLDEVVMEYGQGRGTLVHVRELVIGKPDRDGLRIVFGSAMNGYIFGVPQDDKKIPASDMWLRRYAFTESPVAKGRCDIQLCLVPPERTPWYIGYAHSTGALQFPKLVYRFDADLRTYELETFEFRKLK